MSGKTHICTRKVHITIPKRMGPRRGYSSYKKTWTIRYINNTKIYVRKGVNTLCWYHHLKYIDDLDTSDVVAGNQMRFVLGVYLD